MSTNPSLLAPEFLGFLRKMRVASQRLWRNQAIGGRRSLRKGSGVEFSDFRQYQPGDDVRYVDWNVYARHERLFLKRFAEDASLPVSVLIDASRSMDFGNPSKLLVARILGAALGYLALNAEDSVALGVFDQHLRKSTPTLRGQSQILPMLSFLDAIEAEGNTLLSGSVREFVHRYPKPGLVFLFSDFFYEETFEETLLLLTSRHFEPHLVQVITPEEGDPEMTGDLKLLDAETAAGVEIAASGSLLRTYRETLEKFQKELESLCHGLGARFTMIRSDEAVEQMVSRLLHSGGELQNVSNKATWR